MLIVAPSPSQIFVLRGTPALPERARGPYIHRGERTTHVQQEAEETALQSQNHDYPRRSFCQNSIINIIWQVRSYSRFLPLMLIIPSRINVLLVNKKVGPLISLDARDQIETRASLTCPPFLPRKSNWAVGEAHPSGLTPDQRISPRLHPGVRSPAICSTLSCRIVSMVYWLTCSTMVSNARRACSTSSTNGKRICPLALQKAAKVCSAPLPLQSMR